MLLILLEGSIADSLLLIYDIYCLISFLIKLESAVGWALTFECLLTLVDECDELLFVTST